MTELRRALRLAIRLALAVLLCAYAALTPAAAQQAPFAEEFAAFAVEDQANPPQGCETLFVGSSSFRLWTAMPADFPGRGIIRRGFGGARIADINLHFDAVVGRYRPAQIVFYAGENDLNEGRSVDAVLSDFERFLVLKRQALGATPVHFVSVKPSLARWADFARQSEFNRRIAVLAATEDDLIFVDVVPPMLHDGNPRAELFISDGLHMSATGYAIWRERIEASLRRGESTNPGVDHP